ncbi:TOBE domain-containing protein [Nocardioides sp. GY 10127]|uniref:TOBE domain-containing protein n=1 Tax=Nocardioides sp. GY 10127 TaxID=2569762 RepID=UPI00197DE2E7|nr:TOBE domain-containing protein [Nocardioides sp. GY 10127]
MTHYAIAEAATVLGVSDDTVRRWVEAGRVASRREAGRLVIDGPDLAELAGGLLERPDPDLTRTAQVSARNRLPGIVLRVVADTVMAQVDMACGPYRLVSLMSTEAATELGLAPGSRVVASVKSTNVTVETP